MQGLRVLLAEDNLLNQQVALELLNGEGVVVDVAENGEQACNHAEATHYDVILMDMHMPVMDGLEATAKIRANPLYEGTPVIAMTANSLQSDRDRCAAVGMVDFISKPFEPEELFSVVAKWAGRTPLAATETMAKASKKTDETAPLIEGLDQATHPEDIAELEAFADSLANVDQR